MRCEDFQRRLPEYLRGELEEPLFGEMADHEAECAACQALACAMQAEVAPVDPPAPVFARGGLLDSVLAGTTGGDCLYMEQRLSERTLEPLSRELEARLTEHLASCAPCRRLRDVLEELPLFYAANPTLHAGRDFTDRVLRRTVGREPGFLEVLRALLRRPEAIWEAAAACAFVSMIAFGPIATRPGTTGPAQPAAAIEAGLRGVGGLLVEGVGGLQDHAAGWGEDGLRAAQSVWSRFLGEMAGASRWMEHTGRDLRTGNTSGLLLDLDAALPPLHLAAAPAATKVLKPKGRP